MCLDYIGRKYTIKRYKKVYKIFMFNTKTGKYKCLYSPFEFHEGQNFAEVHTITGFRVKYKSGFHCFENLKDAADYVDRYFPRNIWVVIMPVIIPAGTKIQYGKESAFFSNYFASVVVTPTLIFHTRNLKEED